MHAVALPPAAHPTIVTLGRPGAVAAIARFARAAMLEFANGAARWDKRRLAQWLTEAYAPIVLPRDREPSARARRNVVIESELARVICDARVSLLSVLRLAQDGGHSSLGATALLRAGALAPCEDTADPDNHDPDAIGFVPVSYPRMRLEHRVLSLWAVDYLANGDEYTTDLTFCRRCGHVEFDALSLARGTCRAHSVAANSNDDLTTIAEVASGVWPESASRIKIRRP